MGNCLVTKLKETIDNGNLEKFNTIVLKRSNSMSSTNQNDYFIDIRPSNGKSYTAEIKNLSEGIGCFGATYAAVAEDTGITSFRGNSASRGLFVSKGTFDIEISPKYDDIIYWQSRKCIFIDDLDYICYAFSPNITNFHITDSEISGDIASLAKFENFLDIRVNGTQISGDVATLGKLINLGTPGGLAHFSGSKIGGSVREWMNNLKENGKRSSIIQYVPSSYMTDIVGTESGGVYTVTFDANGDWE